jgi:hypothetical protein
MDTRRVPPSDLRTELLRLELERLERHPAPVPAELAERIHGCVVATLALATPEAERPTRPDPR